MSAARGLGGTPAAGNLQAVLDTGGAPAARLLAALETRMAELAASHGEQLGGYAGDTLSAGGKRLRPLLVFLAAGAPPPESDGLLRAGVAVELIHSATLVHDDVLDGSPLRRGRPTVVAAGGRRMATATGDLLLSRAFAELAAGGSAAAVRTLSRASTELAAGELIQRADAWRVVPVERYLERCRLKTGVLFRAACELGAIHGSGPVQTLGAFGETIGIAFQLLDDVLDVTGPPERTGKPRGADLLDGTVTLPLLLARERSPQLAALRPRDVTSAEQAAEVCDAIESTGALNAARQRALEMIAAAKAQLPVLDARQRQALDLVADGVVERYA